MYWSQTESSKCSLESMFNHLAPPFSDGSGLHSGRSGLYSGRSVATACIAMTGQSWLVRVEEISEFLVEEEKRISSRRGMAKLLSARRSLGHELEKAPDRGKLVGCGHPTGLTVAMRRAVTRKIMTLSATRVRHPPFGHHDRSVIVVTFTEPECV